MGILAWARFQIKFFTLVDTSSCHFFPAHPRKNVWRAIIEKGVDDISNGDMRQLGLGHQIQWLSKLLLRRTLFSQSKLTFDSIKNSMWKKFQCPFPVKSSMVRESKESCILKEVGFLATRISWSQGSSQRLVKLGLQMFNLKLNTSISVVWVMVLHSHKDELCRKGAKNLHLGFFTLKILTQSLSELFKTVKRFFDKRACLVEDRFFMPSFLNFALCNNAPSNWMEAIVLATSTLKEFPQQLGNVFNSSIRNVINREEIGERR